MARGRDGRATHLRTANSRGREVAFEDAKFGSQMLAHGGEGLDGPDPVVDAGAAAEEVATDSVFGDVRARGDIHGRAAKSEREAALDVNTIPP